jgi:hypothetical protein
MTNGSDEETDDPVMAGRCNYKVEKRSRNGLRVELMLYAGPTLLAHLALLSCRTLLPL